MIEDLITMAGQLIAEDEGTLENLHIGIAPHEMLKELDEAIFEEFGKQCHALRKLEMHSVSSLPAQPRQIL